MKYIREEQTVKFIELGSTNLKFYKIIKTFSTKILNLTVESKHNSENVNGSIE